MDNKSSKGLNVVLIIFLVITISIVFFLYYKIEDNNRLSKEIEDIKLELNKDKKIENFNLNGENSNIDFESISGVYTYSLNSDEEDGYFCELYLFNNGTFKYEYCSIFAQGVIGNYIIKGNKIVLNKLFETGSDIGLTVTEGEAELNLNEDGTISNINKILDEPDFINDLSNVKLTKLSKDEEKEYIEMIPNINEILYYSVFSNKVDEVVE